MIFYTILKSLNNLTNFLDISQQNTVFNSSNCILVLVPAKLINPLVAEDQYQFALEIEASHRHKFKHIFCAHFDISNNFRTANLFLFSEAISKIH